jgi:hypothetical protein
MSVLRCSCQVGLRPVLAEHTKTPPFLREHSPSHAPAGKAGKGDMIRIIISKDLFAGCDAEMAVAYAALQAASRGWAGEELVHKARPARPLTHPPAGTATGVLHDKGGLPCVAHQMLDAVALPPRGRCRCACSWRRRCRR